MTVYEYARGERPSGKRVCALGFFDGVHLGHRALFREARAAAGRLSLPFAVFTFISESRSVKSGGERLYSTADKLSLIEECGADEVILADFDSLKSTSPEDFVHRLLCGECGTVCAVTGEDFRFGRGAAGDASCLRALIEERGGTVITVPDVTLGGEKVSTSAVKRALCEGRVEAANAMLGSPFFIGARVEHGRGVGRTLGFPTVNCSSPAAEGVLRRGVYRSEVSLGGARYPALTNVGTCPTFEERESHAETYILDFDGAVYDENIRIYLYEFLRDEKRFSSPEELKMQIKLDINRVKRSF